MNLVQNNSNEKIILSLNITSKHALFFKLKRIKFNMLIKITLINNERFYYVKVIMPDVNGTQATCLLSAVTAAF